MQAVLLAAWTIREWLSLFTLAFLAIFPIVAMWRFFVKGPNEKDVQR